MRDCLITLYHRPPIVEESQWRFNEEVIPSLTASDAGSVFMESTFELVREQLERELNVYAEPDGSFALGGLQNKARWEVVGMMYDAGPSLAYVEFQGAAPKEVWLQLLNCMVPAERSDDRFNQYMVFVRDAGRFLAVEVFLEGYASQSKRLE